MTYPEQNKYLSQDTTQFYKYWVFSLCKLYSEQMQGGVVIILGLKVMTIYLVIEINRYTNP